MRTNYIATIIGTLILIVCLGTMDYAVLPLLAILPIGASLERIYVTIFNNIDYSVVATLAFLTLLLSFFIVCNWFLKTIKKWKEYKLKSNIYNLLLFFSIQFIIVHPLVFYFWAIFNSKSSGDGQFVFLVFETFPISSYLFPIIGFVVDIIKNRQK